MVWNIFILLKLHIFLTGRHDIFEATRCIVLVPFRNIHYGEHLIFQAIFAIKRSFLYSVYAVDRLILDHCNLTKPPSDYSSLHTLAQHGQIFLTSSLCLSHTGTILLSTILIQFARNYIKIITFVSNNINFPIMHKFKSFTVLEMRTR